MNDTDTLRPLFEWHMAEQISVAAMRDNELTEATAGGRQIGLLRRHGNVYAFAAKCPHAGVPLCTGWLDAQGRIVCPEHKYRFDPVNGRNTSGEGYKLFTYPVQVRGDEVWVGLMPQ
ncbi:hypothetical protein GCM10023093_12700 [Nemorincola caseinilytica]|uniref:Rieske domain-containing protein n=1 Tax=Nemorincola caseinilytica TaxID=2054315 RepID=A0ABP8NDA5_9BACT